MEHRAQEQGSAEYVFGPWCPSLRLSKIHKFSLRIMLKLVVQGELVREMKNSHFLVPFSHNAHDRQE